MKSFRACILGSHTKAMSKAGVINKLKNKMVAFNKFCKHKILKIKLKHNNS